jgi:hypothetical protein
MLYGFTGVRWEQPLFLFSGGINYLKELPMELVRCGASARNG